MTDVAGGGHTLALCLLRHSQQVEWRGRGTGRSVHVLGPSEELTLLQVGAHRCEHLGGGLGSSPLVVGGWLPPWSRRQVALSATVACSTWAQFRKFFQHHLADQVGSPPGPAEPLGQPLEAVEPAEHSGSASLRTLLQQYPKLQQELLSWTEENVASDVVREHVAFARLTGSFRKASRTTLLQTLTQDATWLRVGEALRPQPCGPAVEGWLWDLAGTA